ncbi:Malonyl CoA-acyl carrier protein transacylase [Labilithrix luteola]|uniref:Malonyl CoA-acyl carrier protein transacylase n=1 Tax=Labilithrix luteola TaxID=1391654 RepID=A0A0K1QDZ4_9BACT|nr:ACP S-malonyltransferase [Labilithrix luteola]AKV03650.1 Malonyl CoA-acyl carrier protein transacylase [Labilithrix luteola]
MQIAWLFPGQGSQAVGMGKDLLEASPAARDVFARADAALGESLSKLILEGPEDALTLTANAQPALVTMSTAVLAAIREKYPQLEKPRFAAGHSLGEYSALVAAGALSLEDAVRLVRARGRAMQGAVPPGEGAMAAIMGADASRLEQICREVAEEKDAEGNAYGTVACANFNAPGQIVIAGTARAVARVSERAGEEKAKAIPLKVSAPFHCALMAPAAIVVRDELAKVDVKPFDFPVVANVDARPNSDPARVKELLVRQVDGAVRWEQAIRLMHMEGITHAIEIGPGKVLAGLGKRIAKEMKILSVGDVAGVNAVGEFLTEQPAA